MTDGVSHSLDESENDLPDEPLDSFEAPDGSLLFQHNILDGMDERFHNAEAVYSEPAWPGGYEQYMQRVGAESMPGYEHYIGIQERIIRELDVPAYLMGGRQHLSYLNPDDGHEFYFDLQDTDFDAWMYCYNGASEYFDPYEVETGHELLTAVTDSHDWLLDFNCGMGRVARWMVEREKNYICSDVNGRCIHRIAADLYDY